MKKSTKGSGSVVELNGRYADIVETVSRLLVAKDNAKRQLDPLKDPSNGLTAEQRLAKSYSLWIEATGATGSTPEVKQAYQAYQAWHNGRKPTLGDGSVLTLTSRRFVKPDESGVATTERSLYRAERVLTLVERLPLIERQKEALDRLHKLAIAAAKAK